MIFNSFSFLAFIVIVVFLYYIFPKPFSWIILLISSCIFYMAWQPVFMVLLAFSILINYSISLKIYSENNASVRKNWLIFNLVLNFGLLFIFKYMPFVNQTFSYIYGFLGLKYTPIVFNIMLPIGISFYTFQSAGYTVDVYKNKIEPEKNFFKFALFILFFPPLVAGPIERAKDLLPQLFTKKDFDTENIITGLKFMIFGFFKKVVIADRIALAVNTVYNTPTNYEGLYFITATFLFAFQLYCDFCGYSDIAVGCAKLFGIDLTLNFKQPYLSKSIKEFWRRWHISLSFWFKDYIYFPLGGSRVKKPRHYFNTMVTFLISGLWHGADWTYIIWGSLHGIYQIIGDITKRTKERAFAALHIENFFLVRMCKVLITFILVCFSYIFFRGNNMNDAVYIIRNLFTGSSNWTNIQYIYYMLNGMGLSIAEMITSFGCIFILIMVELLCKEETVHAVLMRTKKPVRFAFYLFISLLILSLGVYYNAGEFIYFQF